MLLLLVTGVGVIRFLCGGGCFFELVCFFTGGVFFFAVACFGIVRVKVILEGYPLLDDTSDKEGVTVERLVLVRLKGTGVNNE